MRYTPDMPTPLEDKFILLWREHAEDDRIPAGWIERHSFEDCAAYTASAAAGLLTGASPPEAAGAELVLTPRGLDLLATADAIGYDPSPADSDCPDCAGKGEVEQDQTVEIEGLGLRLETVPHLARAYVDSFSGPDSFLVTEACPACKPAVSFVFQGDAVARSFERVSDSIARTVAERIRSSNLATDPPWTFRDPLPPFVGFDSRCYPKTHLDEEQAKRRAHLGLPALTEANRPEADLAESIRREPGFDITPLRWHETAPGNSRCHPPNRAQQVLDRLGDRAWITGTDAITSFLTQALESKREIECQWEGGEALHIKDVTSVRFPGNISVALNTVQTDGQRDWFGFWYHDSTSLRPVITAIRYRTATAQSPDLSRKLTPGDSDLRRSFTGAAVHGFMTQSRAEFEAAYEARAATSCVFRLGPDGDLAVPPDAAASRAAYSQNGLARRIVDRPVQGVSPTADEIESAAMQGYVTQAERRALLENPSPPQIESRKPDPNPPGFGED